jgi:GT2 family glycosyltransferase
MTEPLVSYVIITRNRRGEVVNCLKSLRQQDYPNKQIIVINNGSNDDSASAIRQDFPEALLIKLETNHGVSGGRNRGAAAASGEICVFIDDDAQLADRQATRRIIRYFDDDPNLACLALKVCDPVTGNEDYRAIPRADKRRVEHDYQCAYFCGAGFVLRRYAWLEVGMFWESLVYGGEELDLSYRLLDRGYRLHRTSSIAVLHRNVTTGRQRGQESYFYARNRCWIAMRNLPWLYVFTTTGLWWAYILMSSAKRGEMNLAARGIWDALRGAPPVLQERRPIGKNTVRTVKALSGRLWC